jgi:Uma2 family endonuclease
LSVVTTNRKLVEQLRLGLDLEATQAALDRGEITPRQAKNIVKWIMGVKDARENAPYAAVVTDAGGRQYVGEVVSKNRGATWIGRRYGRNYPHDSAEFTEQEDAVNFVGQEEDPGSARPPSSADQAMNAVFTPTPMRITTDRYQKMVAAGVLTRHDRIELIEGEMLDRAPISARHAALTARLAQLFILAACNSAIVSPGGPVNLGDFSEPQPDLMLLKRRADFYSIRIPEAADVLLLIEVSDSTLTYDQGDKLSLYARYSVAEYWVVDVAGQRVVIYCEPTAKGYVRKLEFAASETVSPQAFPDVKIAVREIFG